MNTKVLDGPVGTFSGYYSSAIITKYFNILLIKKRKRLFVKADTEWTG